MQSFCLSLASTATYSSGPPIPPVTLDLTGCWMMGASNGRPPADGCGTAPLDSGDGLVYLSQASGDDVTACLVNRPCYRPAIGRLTNTSNNVGMLRLQTLTGKGNCSSPGMPSMPSDGLLEHFNFVLPAGWPMTEHTTRGTHVNATDISGVFTNNGHSEGTAGGIFLRRLPPAACDSVHHLPDCRSTISANANPVNCSAVMQADCASAQREGKKACMACLEVPAHHADIRSAGCKPTDVQAFCGGSPPAPPSPLPPETSRNVTGCYVFGGSAGKAPGRKCGMVPPGTNGHAYVAHAADGTVKVCLNQFCSRRLSGTFSTSSNGVGFMVTQTDFTDGVGVGNCTSHAKPHSLFPAAGLFAHIDFVVPAGWPASGTRTAGAGTAAGDGTHTLVGMFVNNGGPDAGILKMDPNVDPAACGRMRELPFCADFVPPPAAADANE